MAVSQPMSQPLEPERQSVAKPLRAMAMTAAIVVGGIHLALAQQRYELDSAWIGSVFVAGALVLIVATGVAASGDRWGRPLMWGGWTVSAAICAAFFVLFVLSRSVGLPGYHRSDVPPEQVLALVVEAAYVVTFLAAVAQARRSSAH
ncbi:MAG TPA: hypothetical protein VFT62_01955 [Mycobacteriales bacterium]|nr:hypothetical protein [Mycobacteriales bacterium]